MTGSCISTSFVLCFMCWMPLVTRQVEAEYQSYNKINYGKYISGYDQGGLSGQRTKLEYFFCHFENCIKMVWHLVNAQRGYTSIDRYVTID